MRLKAFRKIGDPQPIDCEIAMVIVEGAQGQPVVLAADLGSGAIMAEVLKPDTEVEFNRMLQTMGIGKLVFVEDLSKAMVPMSEQHKLPLLTGQK